MSGAQGLESISAKSADVSSDSLGVGRPTNTPRTQSSKAKRAFKIIVIGDSNVGKTCLTFRFCNGRFPEKTEATIGVDFRERTILIDGELVRVQLWDTAGQERFRQSTVPHYYRNVSAVVYVYDVTRLSSFRSLAKWINECKLNGVHANIPKILIGNKCDMPKERVEVNSNDAQRFADSHDMPSFETSAKVESEANHVESIFLTLLYKLKNSQKMNISGCQQDNENSVDENKAFTLNATDSNVESNSSLFFCC